MGQLFSGTIVFAIILLLGSSFTKAHEGHDHEEPKPQESSLNWTHTTSIKKMTGIDFNWNSSDPDWVIMEMTSMASGYVSVGFCPEWKGTMEGCDIVIGWVDDVTGKAFLFDYHAESNAAPILDAEQNYELINGTQIDYTTTIRFRRRWVSTDALDAPLGTNEIQLITAWHPLDPHNFTSIPPHDKNSRSHTLKKFAMRSFGESGGSAIVGNVYFFYCLICISLNILF